MQVEDIFIEEKLMLYLFLLKVYPNIKGYVFLKTAGRKILNEPTMKFNVRRRLYQTIANETQEKEDLVDRGVRHAIEVSYRKDGIKNFEDFTHTRFNMDKPSPRELMCSLAEIISIEVEKFRRNPRLYSKTVEEVSL